MKLNELFVLSELYAMKEQGYVRASQHPTLPLWVYCYTDKTVIEEHWNDVTRRCRGLVVGPDDEIVAHCMPKFHNASEHINGKPYAPALPNEPFKVYEKADGSLGTIFFYEGRWLAATKGGFQSEQAQWAQRWLDQVNMDNLSTANTYTVEIIYPQNRIVVDNGPTETLRLLTVFRPDGCERPIDWYGAAWELTVGGSVIRQYPDAKLSTLLFRSQRNQRPDGTPVLGHEAEGYVLHYASGLRVKVKFADYIRLHGVVTGLTERHVWEILRDGRDLADLLALLPDEYCEWLLSTADRLRNDFHDRAQRMVHDLLQTGIPADPRHFPAFTQSGSGATRRIYDVVSAQAWDSLKPAAVGPWKGDM
ncbi:RNA ligase [Streptomyces sp. NPDC005551]|uniref:RNA ligase n=1 Tax=Streptomyces sp. NPDC005551 TaxID=3364725 RepID=UPI0036B37597